MSAAMQILAQPFEVETVTHVQPTVTYVQPTGVVQLVHARAFACDTPFAWLQAQDCRPSIVALLPLFAS